MYYVWKSDIRTWKGRIVALNLNWDDGFPPLSINCKQLKDRLPAVLEYVLEPEAAHLLDLLETASHYDLYSPAAVRRVVDFSVTHEIVPGVVRGKRNPLITTDYSFVHILDCRKAVDWTKSDVDIGTSKEGLPYAKDIRRLVLDEGAIPNDVPVFRLDEAKDLILASEEFCAEWQRRGLTGATFTSLADHPTDWRK